MSYATINERYAPRATPDIIRQTRGFGCGVPFIRDAVVEAIKYAGNVSFAWDPEEVFNSGLQIDGSPWAPIPSDLPIHFECEAVDEVRLGTPTMFLGEVRRILVRADVTSKDPLEWYPRAGVMPAPERRDAGRVPGDRTQPPISIAAASR